MGERVWVNPKRVQPVEAARVEAAPVEADDAGVRLDYAQSDVNPRFPTFWKILAWVRYVIDQLNQAIRPFLRRWVAAAGGAKQIVFAIALACVLGGLGESVYRYSSGAGVFWMFAGGLTIGLIIRVPFRS